MKNSGPQITRMNTDYKNKMFTVFIVMLSLFLTLLWINDQNHRTEKEELQHQLQNQKYVMIILATKAQQLKSELALIERDNIMAQAYGINYRGLMNQTPTAY